MTTYPIQVGTQKFTFVDKNSDGFFDAKAEQVLQNEKPIDSRKFLERYGLNPKNTYSLNWLTDPKSGYFTQLGNTAKYMTNADSPWVTVPTFAWRQYLCTPELPVAIEPLCVGKTEQQEINMLFANTEERRTVGLKYLQEANTGVAEFMQKRSTDEKAVLVKDAIRFNFGTGKREARTSELELKILKKIEFAARLLGEMAPEVQAARRELLRFQQAANTVVDIIAGRIEAMWNIPGLTEKNVRPDCSRGRGGIGGGCGEPYEHTEIREFDCIKYLNNSQYVRQNVYAAVLEDYSLVKAERYFAEQYAADQEVILQLAEKLSAFNKDYPKFSRYTYYPIQDFSHLIQRAKQEAYVSITCDTEGIDDCPWSDETIKFGPILDWGMLHREK